MQDKVDIIARAFGCSTGRIVTSPCSGKWHGTSDISIRFDNRCSLFIGNERTRQAKTKRVQNELLDYALVWYNPEIVEITKKTAIEHLRMRAEKDNAVAVQKGLKPYTVLNVELHNGTHGKDSGYIGWYYVTIAVEGKIHAHLESGLNHDISHGEVSESYRKASYYTAGALEEADVDYVFNNVGFSTTSGLYTLDISDTVRERAEKTLTELGIQPANEIPAPKPDPTPALAPSLEVGDTFYQNDIANTTAEQELPSVEITPAPSIPPYTEKIEAIYPAEKNNLPFEVIVQTIHFEEPQQSPRPQNFHITDDNLGAGGAKAKYQMNTDALKTLHQIEADNRSATPEEQETLSKYVG